MKKVVGVIVFIVLILPVTAVTAAEIDIDFKGGIGAQVIFTNKEPSVLYNVDWTAILNRGIFSLKHISKWGEIDEFKPDVKVVVRFNVFELGTGWLLGIVKVSGETIIHSSTRLFIIGPFVIILGKQY